MTVNDFAFSDSNYRFTDPVRYFTSTDPYYWEIDNIPLKQLQENDLWLKDQIEDGFKNFSPRYVRSQFEELQPFSDSQDNIVKVRPGRYSARINDATSNPKLQIIERLTGQLFDGPNKWRLATYYSEDLANNIERITSEVADDALFMNGLVERVFTYAVKNAYETFSQMTELPGQEDFKLGNSLLDLYFWPGDAYQSHERYVDVTRWNPEHGVRSAQFFEQSFLKYWRGVARTAIVDVPNELSIEVPSFDQRDFDYIDSDGNIQQNNNASVRIDLLFIYSKPIDASSVKIKGSDQVTPRTITEPTLGLVRGAGVILDTNPAGESFGETNQSTLDNDGNVKILASPADQANTNAGFKGLNIHGSFPSPDDLMNTAPLLLETLEANNPRLVGQTVLPVAYVVVRRDAATNEFGLQVITNNNIIDIRPLMRTAELTYNERAGIAAALPQLSIANPVVTEIKLKRVSEDIGIQIANIKRRLISDPGSRTGRIVGGGVVHGGWVYGPEAALRHHYFDNLGLDSTEAYARYRDTYQEFFNSMPWYGEWDIASWVPDINRGESVNDRVNILMTDYPDIVNGQADSNFLARSYAGEDGIRLNSLAGPKDGETPYSNEANKRYGDGLLMFFVKKTIQIETSAVPWMSHYQVNASLKNCLPICYSQSPLTNVIRQYKGASNIWVETRPTEFTIYCSWVGMQNIATINFDATTNVYNQIRSSGLRNLRNNSRVTAGFVVITDELMGLKRGAELPNNSIKGGICVYPTITFNIVGFPRRGSGYAGYNLAANNRITLR